MNDEKARSESRNAVRYDLRIPVEMLREHESRPRSYQCDNVSRGGLYVRSEQIFQPNELIYVRFELPLGKGVVCFRGRVVHSVPPSSSIGAVGGCGLVWDPLNQEGLDRWVEFTEKLNTIFARRQRVAQERVGGMHQEGDIGPASAQKPSRVHQRYAARLQVRFKSLDDLSPLTTTDVSTGGLFLKTEENFVVGDLVEIQIIHPETGKSFVLSAGIRWLGQKGGSRGIGIEFLDGVISDKFLFESFVHNHLAERPPLS